MADTVINIYNYSPTSNWVGAPANPTDFSTLPGDAIPIDDQGYFANRDANTIWKISKSDTQWRVIDTNSIS